MKGERGILTLFMLILFGMAAYSIGSELFGASTNGYYAGATCLVSGIAISIPIVLRWRDKITLPVWFIFLIFLALFLHALGVMQGYYDTLNWWDSVTHYFSSMMVAAISFIFIYLADWYLESVHIPPRLMPVIVVAVGCSFGVIWEIFEWSADTLFDTGMQYSLDDTMQDLLMDFLGALTMGVVGWIYLRQHSPGDLAMELGLDPYLSRLSEWWGSLLER